MRIAAICLPDLRVEVVRATREGEGIAEGEPLAIVVAPEPLTEAKLLGNTRLDVVSREARMLGVEAGMTIAAARAKAHSLTVRVVRPDAVKGVLARLAEVALAFGATVSFATASDAVDSPGDIVWVDITGCAHLHADPHARLQQSDAGDAGDARTQGETVLGSRLAQVFAGLGHRCAVAIADGPRIAAILARAAATESAQRAVNASVARSSTPHAAAMRRRANDEDESDAPPLVVVPSGQNAVAMAPLPVACLPLAPEDVRWLAKIGVRRIRELRELPRAALASRLGARARARATAVLCLAEGEDRAPLTPYVPPEIPEESAVFEYGVEGTEALTFVAKTLTDRLALRLAGRAVAAARIELDVQLDAALLRDREGDSSRIQRVAIELPQPLSSAGDLLAALRPKIERLVLRAPALGVKLRAASLVHKPQSALSLFEPQPKAERALPRLVAELASDLGETAVGKLALGDSWSPGDRSRFVRLTANDTSRQNKPGKNKPGPNKPRHLLSSVPEPTRVLDEAMPVARDAVRIVRHLSRIEAVEWWKVLPGEGPKKGVDYVYAWVDEGAAWVEIDRASGAARVRGWFD